MLTPDTTARISDHSGFWRMFAPGRLTVGVFFPIEAYRRDEPTMREHERLAQQAEKTGLRRLVDARRTAARSELRDLGQVYAPWVWLGRIAAQTYGIALATGPIILPLRHPVHTAKPRRPSTSFPAAASCSASRPVTPPRRIPGLRRGLAPARCLLPRELRGPAAGAHRPPISHAVAAHASPHGARRRLSRQ